MHRFATFAVIALLGAGAGRLDAQSRPTAPTVPQGYQPPPGMCRIWLDGVPPAQQPAPTDCATAVRNRPANGRVLFGDDGADGRRSGTKRVTRGDRPETDDRADARVDDQRAEDRRDDRYARGFRGGSDVCSDQNRDGVCDDAQGNGGVCVDRDRDGVCDDVDPTAGGRSLPLMSAAAQYARGERPADAVRWIGAQSLTARLSDVGRSGAPARVVWLNDRGDVVQIWIDRDRDGRADRIELYRDGRRVQSVGQY